MSSNSPRVMVPGAALTCLAESLQVLHDDTDAFHRGELLSIFRRFLTRLSVSRSVVDRRSKSAYPSDVAGFLTRYTTFLRTELAPHSSYGRHILALDLICFIAEISAHHDHEFPFPMMADGRLLSSLFRLILDPYDDVRTTAAQALSQTTCLAATDLAVAVTLKDAINDLEPKAAASTVAAATNRADHADALGRTIDLMHGVETLDLHQEVDELNGSKTKSDDGLQSLAQQFCTYIKSIRTFDVSTQYPLHGNILGISYVIRSTRLSTDLPATTVLQQNLLNASKCVWVLSQAHLCVDSPEMEIETAQETVSLGPKDALAYAWRALRDSNLLMQAMLETYSPEMYLLQTIGDTCFEQLALLRHRGAFSTVAQTFVLCCQKARNSEDERLPALISQWFSRALHELEEQAEKLTRRSAGLPAIFTALLHSSNHEQFSTAFQALVEIATQATPHTCEGVPQDRLRLPQVHALNCMKDIMTSSRFRTMTEPLVVSTINIAAHFMGSSIWAIKNCGLMLLSASINRLDPDTSLGASEAGLNFRGAVPMAFRPLEIALALLQIDSTFQLGPDRSRLNVTFGGSEEAEFAGLDLLGRLYMGPEERVKAKIAVVQKLRHRLWHIRAQAARLFANLSLQGEEINTFHEMLSGLESSVSNNECHGRLLVAQNLLRSVQEKLQIQDYLPQLVELLVDAAASPTLLRSSLASGVWLELATESYDRAVILPDEQEKLRICVEQIIRFRTGSAKQANALFNRASSIFLSSAAEAAYSRSSKSALIELTGDEDISVHVLGNLQPSMPYKEPQSALNLLTRAMSIDEADDVRASAMNAACSFLQHTTARPLDMVHQINFSSLVSRDVRNAQVKLYAHLSAQLWLQCGQEGLSQLKHSAYGFCLHLRAVANDELEDQTRKAAVDALVAFKGIIDADQMLRCLCGPTGELQVTSVLYDLLNDDDDEIRLAATEAAATFLSSNGPDMVMRSSDVTGVFCAAASRQKLRDQIMKKFGGSGILELECWRRILGIKTIIAQFHLKKAIYTYSERNSVGHQLNSILDGANDLFAEEKQNLYIDEVAELRFWADMVVKNNRDPPNFVPSALVSWSTEGLRDVSKILIDGNLSSSLHYNANFEMLLMRVVTVARIVGTSKEGWEGLQKQCLRANMSETVLSAFTWSLG